MKTTALSQMNMYNTSVLYGIQQMCTMIHIYDQITESFWMTDARAFYRPNGIPATRLVLLPSCQLSQHPETHISLPEL